MNEIFKNAINEFMFMVKPWEMSSTEQESLKLAQQGNVGAFCDLLASQGLRNNSCFNEFYAWVNEQPE